MEWNLSRTLSPWRLRVYPTTALLGLAVGFVVFLATSDGLRAVRGGRIGGDLPAFYGAAKMIQAGTPHLLYSSEAQREVQAGLFPGAEQGWLPFPYPPYVAAAYAPLALLPFKVAYVAHTVVMVLCCILALWLLRPLCPPLATYFLPCVAASLTFYPLFRANVGGQNTALSLLCAAGAAAALAGQRNTSAGLWLALWLFKPQLAVPAIAVVLLAGYRRILPGLATGALVWYVIGALIAGVAWPVWWLTEGALPFAAADLVVDRGNGVSLREWAAEIGTPALGWISGALSGAFVLASVWKYRAQKHPLPAVAAGASLAVLAAPHALFYDAGLALLAAIAAAAVRGAAVVPLAAGLWLLALAQIFRAYLPLPPLTVVLFFALLMSLHALRSASRVARRVTDERQPPISGVIESIDSARHIERRA